LQVSYTKDALIGVGSFAWVFTGSCRGQPCAIKKIVEEVGPKDWAFLHELEALSRLKHENVIGFMGETTHIWMPLLYRLSELSTLPL
jgi:serine/threonine protein kinase